MRRVEDPHDRRGGRIELTTAGLRKVDAVLAKHLAVERELLAALSSAQQAQLISLLRRLLLGLGDAETIGPAPNPVEASAKVAQKMARRGRPRAKVKAGRRGPAQDPI